MTRRLFFLLLGLQFAVPAWLLTQPRPARFGWQMFSDYRLAPDFFLVEEQGQEQPISAARYRIAFRNDVPAEEALARHLLQLFPEAVAVRWRVAEQPCGEVRR